MDLLERYLQAVGQYLPDATREDTLAELRANLLERMDERAEELGRTLEQRDVEAILREHGKPEVVALRYLPQRSLIGPTIFPFYTQTLTKVLPLVVFVSFIARGIVFASSRHESLARALVHFALGVCSSLLITGAMVTVIFAGIEWALARGMLGTKWNEWDPAKLPPVKTNAAQDSSLKSIAKRVFDLCVHCLWMAYVLWVPWHPFWIMGPGIFILNGLGVKLGPVWHTFYALLIVLLSVQLVMKLLALRSGVHGWMKTMKWATDLLGVVALGIVACSKELLVPASAAANLQKLAEVNHSMGLGLRVALVFAIAGLVKEAWQFAKRKGPVAQFAF
jgi:hypothetical protein